jgi:hypothetical protein
MEITMAFAFVQDLPTDWETYEKIVAEVGLEGRAPEGLIVHTAGRTPDGVRIIDVWESEQAHRRFADDRLLPARNRVLGEQAARATPAAQFSNVEHLVRP